MNTNKKLIILSLALLLCITIGGTLAYSASVEDNKNVFSTGRVSIEQLEKERVKDASGRYTNVLTDFTQEKNIDPAYYVNDEIEYTITELEVDGVTLQNRLYANSVKNVVDKFVFIKNTGKTNANIRTIIAFECPKGFDYSLIKANLNENENIEWNQIGYVNLGEYRYYFIAATYKEALTPEEISIPSLLQVLLVPKTTNEHMDLLGDTFDILVKTQAAQSVEDQTSNQVLNKVFGEMTPENIAKWFDLRPKFDVENYDQLTTAISSITKDSIINVKDDIDEKSSENIGIENKKIDIYGNDFTMKLGTSSGYGIRVSQDSIVNFDSINLVGGGYNVSYGAKVTINGGSVSLSNPQGPRYNIYAASEGTEVIINGGTYSFESTSRRAYICAHLGARVVIKDGIFGKPSSHNSWKSTPISEFENGIVIIQGGTFGFDPTTWVADGYQAVKSGSTWTVVPE